MSGMLVDSSVAEPGEVYRHWWVRSGIAVTDRGMWDKLKLLEKLTQIPCKTNTVPVKQQRRKQKK